MAYSSDRGGEGHERFRFNRLVSGTWAIRQAKEIIDSALRAKLENETVVVY